MHAPQESPAETYQERFSRFTARANRLQVIENRLAMGRLASFVAALVALILLWRISYPAAIVVCLCCVILFAWLVKEYVRVEKEKLYYRHLATINDLEIKAVSGDFRHFADGKEFIDRDHANAYDLDLFGSASVFQFLNRTISQPGYRRLASWLLKPADKEEILKRQKSVLELSKEIDWRQDLMTHGYFAKETMNSPGELLKWMQQDPAMKDQQKIRMLINVLSVAILAVLAGVVAGLPLISLLPVMLVNGRYYFQHSKAIQQIHNQVSKTATMLKKYGEIITDIEDRKFESNQLRELQQVFLHDGSASRAISQLSKRVEKLDSRLNVLVSVPLNLFFFRDIRLCLSLEEWKRQYGGNIRNWLSAMAELEALNCLANVQFNNPGWAMPELTDRFFTLEAENMGHMLIPAEKRVTNDLLISSANRMLIITGSNMSGKSTFLRTCGVNAILAMAGSPVCASRFVYSHAPVFSSMRISDSLEDNTSSFYAELKRLSFMIRTAEKDPRAFLLLDEILRGTNSNDRHTGSVALIRQLSSYGTVALVATHDLSLASLEKELPGVIENYHFDVKVEGEELYFDYKLNSGICKSMNASILMKKMGIKIK